MIRTWRWWQEWRIRRKRQRNAAQLHAMIIQHTLLAAGDPAAIIVLPDDYSLEWGDTFGWFFLKHHLAGFKHGWVIAFIWYDDVFKLRMPHRGLQLVTHHVTLQDAIDEAIESGAW